MAPHTRNGYITPRDLLLREATLLDYFNTWIEQVELLLSVTRLNYATSFCQWSIWAASLGSLAHQIGARSLYLSALARIATKPMHARRMSYSCATATCLRLFEESYESAPPGMLLGPTGLPTVASRIRNLEVHAEVAYLSLPPWPHEHENTQQDRVYQQGY